MRRTLLPILGGLVLLAGPACAQQGDSTAGPPRRIGDTYDGLDHQPTQSEVRARERSDGIQPSAREEAREAATVDQLYEQLVGPPPTGPAGDRCAPAR